jgi:hypothetical protein
MAQRKPIPAMTDSRAAWRTKMDDANACIAANAEVEELVGQPLPQLGVVGAAGPFTMEGVISHEQGPDADSPIGGASDALEAFDGDASAEGALGAANGEAPSKGCFDALSGFESLPFARPTRLPARAPWRVAVKVIDPRGNESLRVLTMQE